MGKISQFEKLLPSMASQEASYCSVDFFILKGTCLYLITKRNTKMFMLLLSCVWITVAQFGSLPPSPWAAVFISAGRHQAIHCQYTFCGVFIGRSCLNEVKQRPVAYLETVFEFLFFIFSKVSLTILQDLPFRFSLISALFSKKSVNR